MGFTIKGEEAGKSSSVGKGPSEAPAIDQKIMSVAGIRAACPLLAFMCWRSCRVGWGGTQKNGMEEGRTYEIATFFKLSPN